MNAVFSRFSCAAVLLVFSGCGGCQQGPFSETEEAHTEPALPRGLSTRPLVTAQTVYRVVAEDKYLDFSTPAAYKALGQGWQTLDRKLFVGENWIWATGLIADLNITVLQPQDLYVTMRVVPHYVEELPAQVLDIYWETVHIGTVEFDKNKGWSPVDVEIQVPASAQSTGENTITFCSRHAVAQQLVGAGNEMRQASFGLSSVKLSTSADIPASPDTSQSTPSNSASSVQFLESGIQQAPHGDLVIPVRLPERSPTYFQIHNLRNALARGGSVIMRWDTTEGPMTMPLTSETPNIDEDDSSFWDISAHRGSVIEFRFRNAGNEPILWQAPSIRYPNQPVDVSSSSSPVERNWPSTRNVVLVVLDALRADALGCYGALQPTSPFIDSLAAQGILFERCYASGTYTFASTTSLLTSLHPFQHNVVYWKDRLSDASLLLQNVLSREGIYTTCVSQNPFLSAQNVIGEGFDDFAGVFETASAAAHRVTEKALELAANAQRKPLFLYVHYLPPHAPYSMAGEFQETLSIDPLKQIEGTPEGIKAINWGTRAANRYTIEQLRARYGENVRTADQAVEDLVRGLRELGLGEETTLILTADHGEEFLEHGWVGHGSYPYNTVSHIPLIITTLKETGVLAHRRNEVVGTPDVYPTVCQLLGISPAHPVSGHDLLTTPASEPRLDEVLAYTRGNEEDAYVAFYFERYKYLATDSGQWQALFDLERDPDETVNLSGVLPVLFNYLSLTAEAWENACSVTFTVTGALGDQTDIGHEEELKALGYL